MKTKKVELFEGSVSMKVKLKTELRKHLQEYNAVRINNIDGFYLGDNIFILKTDTLPQNGMIKWMSLLGNDDSNLQKYVDIENKPINVIQNLREFYYELQPSF
jgi:hypothetical protein